MFERVETARLILRKPERGDAPAIFARYASDKEVTRLLAWPRHVSIQDTHTFLEFSDAVQPANVFFIANNLLLA